MNQNSVCFEISNHIHPAIVLLGIHQMPLPENHSRTCAAHEGLQLRLIEDSLDAMTSTQIITTDNTHFFNTEQFPTPERDRVALQEGFYMASSVFPQPTTVRL